MGGSAPAIVSTYAGPPGTLGALAAEVTNWLKGDMKNAQGQRQIRDAVNDAISMFWMSAIKVKLSRFMGADSPVTLQIGSNVERLTLVSIPDPVLPPITSAIAAPAGTQNIPARTYNAVGWTLVTESGSETNISPFASQAVPANELLTAQLPIIQPSSLRSSAGLVGWNLYAGVNQPGLQNSQPLGFGQQYIEPIQLLQDYPKAAQQPPTVNSTYDNLAYIEHMEVQLPDGTHLAWNQSSIDSDMMRKLARVFPNASQYQTFAWDIINGNVIELRPQSGLAQTTRYWYVSKPRRLRYDQARIPYINIQGVWEFCRDFAIMKCKLSLEEYLAFQAWQSIVQTEQNQIIEALMQENWSLDNRVVPYLY